jgi:hypothetical protein
VKPALSFGGLIFLRPVFDTDYAGYTDFKFSKSDPETFLDRINRIDWIFNTISNPRMGLKMVSSAQKSQWSEVGGQRPVKYQTLTS